MRRMFERRHLQSPCRKIGKLVVLTVWKGQNTDDEEEGDDQDEPHPEVTVRVSIVSENKERLEMVKTSGDRGIDTKHSRLVGEQQQQLLLTIVVTSIHFPELFSALPEFYCKTLGTAVCYCQILMCKGLHINHRNEVFT